MTIASTAHGAGGTAEDAAVVRGLRAGDERVFADLVRRWQPLMLRVARTYVRDSAVAEEVVQETWLGVLNGIDAFEGRSSVKTWAFRILANRARTRGVRERRSVPFSALVGDRGDEHEPSVDPSAFQDQSDPAWGGWWASYPSDWRRVPDERLLATETFDCVREAIAELPDRQQEVIVLRDMAGLTSEEVCGRLALSEGNQRVLLHRARTKVRRALELRFGEVEVA